MKNVAFTLFLLVTSIYSANAQTIVAPEGKYEVYCDMISYNLWGAVGAKVDMGSSPSKYTDYEYIYEDGKEKRFTSMMGVLTIWQNVAGICIQSMFYRKLFITKKLKILRII